MQRNHFSHNPGLRLLRAGPQSLDDAELLSVIVQFGPRDKAGVEKGQRLLDHFAGLEGIARAGVWALARGPGMTPCRSGRLAAACELAARLAEPPHALDDPIVNPRDSRSYFKARLAQSRRESFACLYLDTRHRPIDFQVVFEGTVDTAAVYPREIVRFCIERDASAVIVGHNHPSGVAEPSHADLAITRRLKEALGLLDIRLLDHLIVTGGSIYSFAEAGHL